MSELQADVISIIENVLKMPAGILNIDSGMGITDGWTSLMMMEIIMAVENKFSIQFQPDEIYDMVNVRDILLSLKNHGVYNAN
ncbi:MAG: acyl carrier protein [Methylococcaceae bacterium]